MSKLKYENLHKSSFSVIEKICLAFLIIMSVLIVGNIIHINVVDKAEIPNTCIVLIGEENRDPYC